MQPSTQQVQNASRRAGSLNDRMDTAVEAASRHGSGARESSREGRRRSRDNSVHGVRVRPTGPEEKEDWLEALSATTNRFDTLERMVRNQAQFISDFDARIVEIVNRINEHSNKMESINNTVTSHYDNLCEACRSVVATYETKEAAAALDAKVDAINHQLQAVMTAVASYGRAVPDTSAQEFDVSTPVFADRDRTQDVPGDPWEKAAEGARMRAGQSANTRSSPFAQARTEAPHPAAGVWGPAEQSPFTPPQQPQRIAPPAASMNQGKIHYMGDQEAINKKDESLRRFDGSAAKFGAWAKHFVDHMSKVHPAWRNALEWFAATTEDLSFSRLFTETLGPYNESAVDLAVKLEQCIVDYLPESMYGRRVQLCGGKSQANNGLAMWKRLHQDFAGEGEVVEYAGVEVLREYSRCNKLSDLPSHLDGWFELLDQYGNELIGAPKMVRSMFLNIIPKDLKNEIFRERSLVGADHKKLAEWCRTRAAVLQHETLAEIVKKNAKTEL